MKNTVKLNEARLKKIVAESVKNILSEIDMGDGYYSLPGEGVEDDRTPFEKCRDALDRACGYAVMAEDAYKKKNIEELHNRFQQVWSCCCDAFEALGYDKPNW